SSGSLGSSAACTAGGVSAAGRLSMNRLSDLKSLEANWDASISFCQTGNSSASTAGSSSREQYRSSCWNESACWHENTNALFSASTLGLIWQPTSASCRSSPCGSCG